MSNEGRFQLQAIFLPSQSTIQIIESELIKTNHSIDRKWSILDDYSINWTYSQWKNFKDGIHAEISYKEYLLILLQELKK